MIEKWLYFICGLIAGNAALIMWVFRGIRTENERQSLPDYFFAVGCGALLGIVLASLVFR